MSEFFVNGQKYSADADENMLAFLRDRLGLTSVKDGCSQGACGACMVLVEGTAKKACTLKAGRLDGKNILTLEGLEDAERDLFARAFVRAGAVQCGFCTPGMIISAKALLMKNRSPSRADIKKAIKNNLCRCTGYKKIEDAILLAASWTSKGKLEQSENMGAGVGESAARVDAYDKACAKAMYTDDIKLDGMLIGGAKRSDYPRAKIKRIVTDKARALNGVVAVLTAEDIPGERKIGHLVKDWDALICEGQITHYSGDALALVAAVDKQILTKALSLIEIEYEPLTPVLCPDDAMKPDAIRVHASRESNLLFEQKLSFGNAKEAIKNSKYVVSNHYSVPFTEHAFLEPECAIAIPLDDSLEIISSDQGVFEAKREISDMLGIPENRVRVRAASVGGAFGGKEDMSVQHHAALLAYHTKRPVKVKLSRDESLLVHPKRHAMQMKFTTACDAQGYLTAMTATIYSDTGAYASLGGPVLQRACTHAAGPYNYHNIEILGRAYYTNNPPGGAFRGFGVPQSCFATECNINQLARLVGISPFEIRYKNAIRPNQVLPNGQIADESTALVETLDAVRPYYEKNPKAGIACAMKNSGLGVGVPDTGRCRIDVKEGKAHIYSSAACVGQGMGTVQAQLLHDISGIDPKNIVWQMPDTALSPDSGNTTASRQTVFTGEAVVRAASKLKSALDDAGSLQGLEGMSFYGEFSAFTDPMGSQKENPVSHLNYSYATHLVELDEKGLVKRVIAAHDIGRAINPAMVQGQIEGGVLMSLGYALSEDFPLENGKPVLSFGKLGLLRADKAPEILTILIEKGKDTPAMGAKGVGEISSIPTAPAVQQAYYEFDKSLRVKLPLRGTPYKKD